MRFPTNCAIIGQRQKEDEIVEDVFAGSKRDEKRDL